MTSRGTSNSDLIADPLVATLDNRRTLGRARLAVDEQPIQLVFITVGAHADPFAKSVSEGRPVAVIGRLVCRESEAEDGTRRSRHRGVGRVQFGDRRDDQPAGSDTEGAPAA